MRLHAQLKAGAFPNCRKLADELEVSSKTIQRDLDFMRDRLGLPIEYDQLHFGFFYTEPVTSFPSIEASEGEIIALFVAEKALAQYKGTSFERPLNSAFKKISDGMRDKISFTWDSFDEGISFRSTGIGIPDLALFETLSKAVLAAHEVEFGYQKLNGRSHEKRRVQPYHLGCVENQWYLFGLDLDRKQMRTFALPRMKTAVSTRKRFTRPANFSIDDFLSESFTVFEGRDPQKVRVRFDAFASRLVRERRWHDSQTIKQLANDEVELSLKLGSLVEIERWVLSWGEHARVLEPKALSARIAAISRAVAESYR